MNLRHLKAFYWVTTLGTYSGAAEHLGVTEPSVFRAVRSLERACRVQLMRKDKGRLRLTQEGRLLHSYAEKIDGLEAMADQLLTEISKPSFVFGTTQLFARAIARSLARWQIERPELRVALLSSHLGELYAQLLEGDLSFAFGPVAKLPPGLCSVGVGFKDELDFIVRAGHPLSKRRLVSISELAQERVISTFPTTATHNILMEISKEADIRFNISTIVNDVKLVVELVAGGDGVGLVSKLNAAEAIKKGEVCFVAVQGLPRFMPFGFVMREGCVLPEEANSLMLHLQSSLRAEIQTRLLEIESFKLSKLKETSISNEF